MWAQNVCNLKERVHSTEQHNLDNLEDKKITLCLQADTFELERWHIKLGHVGTKIITHCQIEN